MNVLAFASLLALPLPQVDDASSSAPHVVAALGPFDDAVTLEGSFAPAGGDEIAFEPQAWRGELRFTEVLPHGSFVNAGDVVARFDTEALDDRIVVAERDLVTAELEHANTRTRAALETESAEGTLARTRAALRRAERDLAGWEETGLELHRRSDELTAQSYRHGIQDQVSELEQLEAMYRGDELIQATEEIILERARRNLAAARAREALMGDRQQHELELEVAHKTERLREAVAEQRAELDRLVRRQELEARAREDRLDRSAFDLGREVRDLERLRGDREGMVLRAARSGVLLHGDARTHREGGARPDYRVGGSASPREGLFTIVEPDRLSVSLLVSESDLTRISDGQAARVTSRAHPDLEATGRLQIERNPTAASALASEASFRARIELDRPLPGIAIGMRADIELPTQPLESVVMLPQGAVVDAGGEATCWVAADSGGSYERRSVELGPRRDGEVVVLSGLRAGEHVLLGAPSGGTR